MDKETFHYILQSAILSFDGVSEDKLVREYGINDKLVRAGISLCEYLKSIEHY